eukprot:CAMPEP_0178946402 /NCGR_PEP_ID=MMETSP0789-20121207/4263_1 /TAXON_ID=3005 /ORGANISM="Rhizosolenia setigera, Strain CCMP 1694" /LENGTH=336 /DNA_ID=CAMNT_0020626385 /DNA_START=1 /DNA_END=1011 /DNA_ORIENTATION=-
MLNEQELEDELTFVEIMGNLLLFLLVFGMSATVDVASVGKQLKNIRALATGVICQFFILPFLGFLAVKSLDMPKVMGLTLLVVTSSPGGSFSNWWCSLFNADLALSVTMTTVSTFLSLVMLPLNLFIYSSRAFDADVINTIDWESLVVALVIVIAAILLGLLCSSKIKSKAFSAFCNKLGNFAGLALIIFSASMTTSEEEASLAGRELKFYIGVASPCIAGLIVANICSYLFGLKKPECVTVTIEACYQNVGIGTSVALTMFKGEELAEALGVPLFYGMVEAVSVAVYCVIAWKLGWTKAPATESILKVISTSYEVESNEGYETIPEVEKAPTLVV